MGNKPDHDSVNKKIIAALLEESELSSFELCSRTGLSSASIFPALVDMVKSKAISERWEEGEAPRRMLYRID